MDGSRFKVNKNHDLPYVLLHKRRGHAVTLQVGNGDGDGDKAPNPSTL